MEPPQIPESSPSQSSKGGVGKTTISREIDSNTRLSDTLIQCFDTALRQAQFTAQQTPLLKTSITS